MNGLQTRQVVEYKVQGCKEHGFESDTTYPCLFMILLFVSAPISDGIYTLISEFVSDELLLDSDNIRFRVFYKRIHLPDIRDQLKIRSESKSALHALKLILKPNSDNKLKFVLYFVFSKKGRRRRRRKRRSMFNWKHQFQFPSK